jgi:hypothetical protein
LILPNYHSIWIPKMSNKLLLDILSTIICYFVLFLIHCLSIKFSVSSNNLMYLSSEISYITSTFSKASKKSINFSYCSYYLNIRILVGTLTFFFLILNISDFLMFESLSIGFLTWFLPKSLDILLFFCCKISSIFYLIL